MTAINDEREIWNDVRTRINVIRGKYRGANNHPNNWPAGAPQLRARGREFVDLCQDFITDVDARRATLGGIPATYDAGLGISLFTNMLQEVDDFISDLDTIPLNHRFRANSRRLEADALQLKRFLARTRRNFIPSAIEQTRMDEVATLHTLQQEIDRVLQGLQPQAGADPAVIEAYKQFLRQKEEAINQKLHQLSLPRSQRPIYNLAEEAAFFRQLDNDFSQFGANLRGNIANNTTTAAQTSAVNQILPIHDALTAQIRNQYQRLRDLNIQNIQDIPREIRRQNIRKGFRNAGRALLRNVAAIAGGAAAGFGVRALFMAAAVCIFPPFGLVGGLALAAVSGAAAGVVSRGVQNAILGTNTQGWMWKSALLGAAGGIAGFGLHHFIFGDWSCPTHAPPSQVPNPVPPPQGGPIPLVPQATPDSWPAVPPARPEIIFVQQNNYFGYPYAPAPVYYPTAYPQFGGAYVTPLFRVWGPTYGGYGGFGGYGPGRPLINFGYRGSGGFGRPGFAFARASSGFRR